MEKNFDIIITFAIILYRSMITYAFEPCDILMMAVEDIDQDKFECNQPGRLE